MCPKKGQVNVLVQRALLEIEPRRVYVGDDDLHAFGDVTVSSSEGDQLLASVDTAGLRPREIAGKPLPSKGLFDILNRLSLRFGPVEKLLIFLAEEKDILDLFLGL